jgi:AcrR family transcriptional regulator
MDPNVGKVKGRRPYDASRRREQARLTREQVLDVAQARFLADGYAVTTIATIAGDAGVSVDTIYKAFGGKPGLVRAIRERALVGAGPVPAEQRSDAISRAAANGYDVVAGWGQLIAEVAPRVAPILLLVRDAAVADPEMATLQRDLDDDRHRRMTDNARALHERGFLRADVGADEAADVLWLCSAPELYERLVLRRHWPIERFAAFAVTTMTSALLPPRRAPGGPPPTPTERAAT